MTRPPIRDDTLLTLEQACEYGFAGGASPATLKHEWSLGNLELCKIGRSYFTTPAKLKAMEQKCLTLEAMDLHIDNPLYDRLRAALEHNAEERQ